MTVTTSTARVVHNGNGTTTQFAVPFRFLENAQVAVFLRDAAGGQTLWVENTQYTLSGADAAGGGTLTVVTSPTDHTPAAGEKLVVIRAVPITQETDYVENDPFPAETHERALDKLTMVNQEQTERLDRTFTIPETDTLAANFVLPSDVERANRFLAFDALANPIVAVGTSGDLNPVSPFMDSVLSAADAASARTQLGAADDTLVAMLAADNALSGDNTFTGQATFDGPVVLGDGSELTIAAGSITPTGNYHTVDTEADAASDALTDVDLTNIPDGGILVLRAASAARTVAVTHTDAAAGKIVLDGDADYTMDDAEKSITLQRRGDHLEEVSRSFNKPTVFGTPVATTSGTSIDITGIPAGAKKISAILSGVSLDVGGVNTFELKLGDSGGFEEDGYVGRSSRISGSAVGANNWPVDAIELTNSTNEARLYDGLIEMALVDGSTNTWVISGSMSDGIANAYLTTGSKSLTGTLDRIRLTNATGVAAFDAGSINTLVYL